MDKNLDTLLDLTAKGVREHITPELDALAGLVAAVRQAGVHQHVRVEEAFQRAEKLVREKVPF